MPKRTRRSTLEPRKYAVQPRSADTVAAILEAAARVLERHGFAGYNTNAVAALAGVSIGSLYQYFPNKDALVAALVERETAVLLDELGAVTTGTSFVVGMQHMIHAAIAHQMRRPALARLLDFEEQRLPLGPRNERVGQTIANIVVSLLDRPGAPRAANRTVAALDVLAIVKGMVDAAGQRGETDSIVLERRVARAVNGYLRS
jgi:AcrR family transcriptional regulator